MILVEACVTTLDEAVEAEVAGASRLELCAQLHTGGLSPNMDLTSDILKRVGIPVNVMVRPYPGDFTTAVQDIDRMIRDTEYIASSEADGVVLGVLDDRFRIDRHALSDLVSAAGNLPVTFHRAFDLISDRMAATEVLIETGISRVLTGGGPGTAWEGRTVLRDLCSRFGNRIEIIAGGSVRAGNVLDLIALSGVGQIHARASAIPDIVTELRSTGS